MKREGVFTMPYQSVETVRVKVKAPLDPTSFSGEVGLAPTGEEDPLSWTPLTWTGERLNGRYFATFVCGPLVQGMRYNVYIRVTDGVNTPTMHAGAIEAF